MSSVLKIVLQRLGLGFLTLFAVSIIIAFVVELLPGDITQAILGQSATPETVAAAAVDEDADAIGLSMLSGAHMTLAPLVVEAVRARGADIPVILGGTVPDHDLDELKAQGVAAVLTPGTTAEDIIKEVQQVLDGTQVG